jgi:hypothetical protein
MAEAMLEERPGALKNNIKKVILGKAAAGREDRRKIRDGPVARRHRGGISG